LNNQDFVAFQPVGSLGLLTPMALPVKVDRVLQTNAKKPADRSLLAKPQNLVRQPHAD
jgi:hypothetical protein